jgi:hypothetical protein
LRRAAERARQAADDEDEARRLELLGLVDRAPVVVERGAPAGRIQRREHAAAAVARELERVAANELGGALETDRMDLVAPRRDGADPVPTHASMIVSSVPAPRSVAVLIESQRWSREKSRTAIVETRAQPSTPCSASRWRMRATASSAARSVRRHRRGGRSRRSGRASARSAGRRPS